MKLFSTALLLATSAFAASDPQLLGLLMPESKIVAGVHLDQAKASQFGQFLLRQAGPTAEIDKIKAATGFDPRTDLSEVVAGAGLDGKGLAIGRGSFQPSRILNLAMTAGAKVENYRGINIIGDEGVAFLDASTVVIGERANVKSAIDRWLAGAADNTLANRVAGISGSSQAWAIATDLASALPKSQSGTVPPDAQMVQNILEKIDQLSGGLTFGENVTVHGQAVAKTPQDAQALADVYQFMIAMGASKAPLPSTPAVTVTGNTVNFTMSVTEQELEQLIQPKTPVRGARIRAVR